MIHSKQAFKLIVFLGLVGISTSSFSQTDNLKVLFNPLEDYVQAKNQIYYARAHTDEERLLSDLLQVQLEKYIETQKMDCYNGYQGVNIDSVHSGSFTRKIAHERAVVYSYCQPFEAHGDDTLFHYGMAILENKTLVANYIDIDEPSTSATYAVTDINQNGLSELLVVVPSTITKGSDIQMLEFFKTQIISLGSIEIGGPGFTAYPIFRVCQRDALVKTMPSNFLSNVIYVKKAPKPIFYRQTNDVTITCIKPRVYPLQAQVTWKKVGGLTQVKLQAKIIPFTKIFSK